MGWSGQSFSTSNGVIFTTRTGATSINMRNTGTAGTATTAATIVNFSQDANGNILNAVLEVSDGLGGFVWFLVNQTNLGTIAQQTSQSLFPITTLVLCFVEGTRIRTPRGDVPIERLTEGDTVVVQDGDGTAARTIEWIGHRSIDLAAMPDPLLARPVRIRQGAFGHAMPARDLLVSPDHAIFVDGSLIPARLLVNGGSIVRDTLLRRFRYFHIELEQHAVVFSENLPTETYLDTGNRSGFENGGPVVDLNPDFSTVVPSVTRETHSCAPFLYDADAVRPVWERLAARAAGIGLAAPAIQTTTDPAPRVAVNGRLFRPVCATGGVYSFMLPSTAREVRLLSNAARPGDARPWVEDRRVLGLYVRGISIETGSECADLALDGPSCGAGWWDVERDGGAMARWTNGDAVLRLPEARGTSRILRLAIGGGMTYPLAAPAGNAAAKTA